MAPARRCPKLLPLRKIDLPRWHVKASADQQEDMQPCIKVAVPLPHEQVIETVRISRADTLDQCRVGVTNHDAVGTGQPDRRRRPARESVGQQQALTDIGRQVLQIDLQETNIEGTAGGAVAAQFDQSLRCDERAVLLEQTHWLLAGRDEQCRFTADNTVFQPHVDRLLFAGSRAGH